MEVLVASSGVEAIQAVGSHAGTIDLLVTDLEMPNMSGWESAKKIAVLKPGIRILFMSAGITAEEWQEHKKEPAGAYFIQKPFLLRELRAVLTQILSESGPPDRRS